VGIALFTDEMQDIPPADVSALCAAMHELSQTGGPLRGRGLLPHLPSVLSAARLLGTAVPLRRSTGWTAAADQALRARPGRGRFPPARRSRPKRLMATHFVQAYGK
jgi:hypothetical protein